METNVEKLTALNPSLLQRRVLLAEERLAWFKKQESRWLQENKDIDSMELNFPPDPPGDPDPDPDLDPDDFNDMGLNAYALGGVAAGIAYAQYEGPINRKLEELGVSRGGTRLEEFKDWITGKKKHEPARLTIDDFVMKFERNITNAFPIAWMSSATTADGIGTSLTRPAEYKDFVRDSEFDDYGIVVYHNEKSKTAWFGSAGNRMMEEMGNPGQTGSRLGMHMDEAARLFALGLYTKDAILKSPRYLKTQDYLDRFLTKYRHYDHRKVTGHSTGSSLLLQYMMTNPGRNQAITWATLFNTPMANSREQRKQYLTFLNRSPKVALIGAEFDVVDPHHRFYKNGRDFVLGYLDNPSLNATLEKYERIKKTNPLLWDPKWGHSLEASDALFSHYIDPTTPMQYFDNDSIFEPIEDQDRMDPFYMPEYTRWEKAKLMAEQTMDTLGMAYKRYMEKRNKVIVQKDFSSLLKEQKKETRTMKTRPASQFGYIKREVQLGGESGMGEGEKFFVFEFKASSESFRSTETR